MTGFLNMTSLTWNPIQLENWMINVFIFVTVVVLIRYLVAWFVSTLMNKGIISLSTKSVIVRVLDITVIILIILGVVESFTASLTPYIVVLVIGIMLFVLFYYEIREFTAFITMQLQKYARGTWIEAYLPGISTSVRGRIVEIDPFSSIIEDLHGNQLYIANSILVNSLIKEYRPLVTMKVSLDLPSDVTLDSVLERVKNVIEETPFRLDESRIPLNSLSKGRLTFTLRLIPLSTPVRTTDLFKAMKRISNVLSEYNPSINIVE